MKATLSQARISSKKVNLIAGMVRRMSVSEALHFLRFVPKKGAKILRKVLVSAVANAENNFAQDRNKLVVQKVLVTPAATLKRWLPIARGSAHPIRKRNSHITVEVGLDVSGVSKIVSSPDSGVKKKERVESSEKPVLKKSSSRKRSSVKATSKKSE